MSLLPHVAAIESRPPVSIITVVRNEQRYIRSCLARICAQDYPKELLEVIVVDGLSTDGTAEIAESFPADGIRLKVLKILEQGRAQGLNRGICEASGDIIVRIDARTIVDSDYVSRCIKTMLETGADNVGGVRRPISSTATQEAIGMALSHPFGVGSTHSRLGWKSGYVDSVYLGCFRRDVFRKVGLFDERAAVINEDWDLNYRICVAGGTVYLDTNIKASYFPRESFLDLWKLYFRYGGARVGNMLKHRGLFSWRYAVAPAFILAMLAAALLSFADKVFAYGTLSVMVLYLIVDLGVSLLLAKRAGNFLLLPKLLLAFPCMHFSWGLGFWKRLLVPSTPGRYWAN